MSSDDRPPGLSPHVAVALEAAWTPSSAIGGRWQPYAEAYRRGTLAARTTLTTHRLSSQVELFLPPPGSATGQALVFVHGGFWQEQTLDDAGFAAESLARRGFALFAVSYPLAPAATLAEIVTSVQGSLRLIRTEASGHGIDPERCVVAGHSAGAHLVAKAATLMSRAWPFGEVVLVSGVFDPEPLIPTSINDALGLNVLSARMLSALPIPLGVELPPALFCWAENDTPPFHAQSQQMARAWRETGAQVRCIGPVADRNHFDLVLDLADPATPLGAAVFG